MIKLLAKLFGGRARAGIASGAVWMALAILAQIMKLDPHLAAMVDPDKLANFLAAAFFTGINLITNNDHLETNSILHQLLSDFATEGTPVVAIPVKRAEPLK